jgi:type IV secretion system protein TrbL
VFDWIFSPVTNIVGKSLKNGFKWIIKFMIATILGMVRRLVEAIVDFFSASSGVSFTSGWWTSDGTQALMRVMGRIGVMLVLLFLVAAIVDGIVHANVGTMVRTVLVQVPTTLAMTGGLVVIATTLLTLSDSMSTALLGSQFAQDRYLELFSMENVTKGGLLAVIFSSFFSIALLFVWVVLFVRAQIIYVLMLFAPVMLAMNIWPSTKKSFRRWVEVSIAMIFAKPVIAGTMALAVAAFTNISPTDPNGVAASAGASLASMLAAVVFMAVACFSPFMLLKLIPVVAASAGGQEAMSKLQSGAKSVGKGVFDSMGGGGSSSGAGGSGSSSGSASSGASGASSSASGPFGAAGGASSGAGGAGAGASGGATAGAGAVAGPAGVAVAAGAAAASTAKRAAAQGTQAAEQATGGDDGGGSPDTRGGAYAMPTASAASGYASSAEGSSSGGGSAASSSTTGSGDPGAQAPSQSDQNSSAGSSAPSTRTGGQNAAEPTTGRGGTASSSVPSSSSSGSGSSAGGGNPGWLRPVTTPTPVQTPTFVSAASGEAGSSSPGSSPLPTAQTSSSSSQSRSSAPQQSDASIGSNVQQTLSAPSDAPSTAASRRARNTNSNLRNPDRTN